MCYDGRMSDSKSIEISFLGGASSIGASCMLVRVADVTLLIDCGVRYSGPSPLPDLSPLAGVALDAILLTHAHMDHCGGLPVAAEANPGAPVLATSPTIDLVSILLRDSLRLMNASDREAEMPLYTEAQVDQLLHSMTPVRYHQPMRVGEIEIRWLPASHILGAAMILMTTPAGAVLFTGDYSVSAQQTVPALGRPDFHADLVVSESTYGQRLHEDRNVAEERLLGQVREVTDGGGRVLIPAFAVGRSQEVLLILKRAMRNGSLPKMPVFVDGMVRAVCDVYRRHEPYVSRQLLHEIRRAPHAFYDDSIQPVVRREDRSRVLQSAPCIIVASSGMLSGGPSVGYCQELAKNAADAVLLTGYQDEESPGRALLDLAGCEGPKELRLGQATVPVACRFGTYGLSAHADRMQMISLIEATSPRTVVLVHGDNGAKEAMARSLRCDDVVCATDGLTLVRSYRPRSERKRGSRDNSPAVPSAAELDIARARHLLGPAGTAPLRAAAIAEAWFGQPVDRTTVDGLARVLESVGLVRRDDHRRDRLWVLGVHETRLFPEEAEREEQLKKANPKGRLLEFCSRMRLDPPETEFQAQGAFFEARMALAYAGRTLDSGPCEAASKKTAEQMAANALLALISQVGDSEEIIRVPDDEVARLHGTNPKGLLLEWCVKSKVPTPDFQQGAAADGYRIRAVLRVAEDQEIVTAWYVAPKLKTAEHAAADAVMNQLPKQAAASFASTDFASPGVKASATVPMDTPDASAAPTGRNPVSALNELRQAGVLDSVGYELLEQAGPSHQPTFVMVAWAKLPDGRSLQSEPACAPAKKAAQAASANSLLTQLSAEGITRW